MSDKNPEEHTEAPADPRPDAELDAERESVADDRPDTSTAGTTEPTTAPGAGSTTDSTPEADSADHGSRDRLSDVRDSEPARGAGGQHTAPVTVPPPLVEPPVTERAERSVPLGAASADSDRSRYVVDPSEKEDGRAQTAVVEPVPVPAPTAATERFAGGNSTTANATTADETTAITSDSAAGPAPRRASERVVYVDAPVPPRRKGNRGVGALIAILSAVIFAVLFALVIVVLFYSTGRPLVNFTGEETFYIPVLLFTLGFLLLVLIVNRGGWWAYIVGSIFVGLFVYLGTIAVILLLNGVVSQTPAEASAAFASGLVNPLVIAAGLLSREVALWMGAAVSVRGKRVKAKNIAAKESFDHAATQRAEYERSGSDATA